jgi:hypothetical protein
VIPYHRDFLRKSCFSLYFLAEFALWLASRGKISQLLEA